MKSDGVSGPVLFSNGPHYWHKGSCTKHGHYDYSCITISMKDGRLGGPTHVLSLGLNKAHKSKEPNMGPLAILGFTTAVRGFIFRYPT